MTCRHEPNDPSCSSHPSYVPPYRSEPKTPDKRNYSVEDVTRVGPHLVVKAKYPNCASCAFEGVKIMVFLNVTENEALRWKEIDPHFRPKARGLASCAPSPAARFPGSAEGWNDALAYAKAKAK